MMRAACTVVLDHIGLGLAVVMEVSLGEARAPWSFQNKEEMPRL